MNSAPRALRWLLRERLFALAFVFSVALVLLVFQKLVALVLFVSLLLLLDVLVFLFAHATKDVRNAEATIPQRTKGRSSVGRAAVSKTVGRGFESLRPCTPHRAKTHRFAGTTLEFPHATVVPLQPIKTRRKLAPLARDWRALSDPTGNEIASDGLPARLIKPHTLEKFDYHDRYCDIVAKGMPGKWGGHVSYLELMAGSGIAMVPLLARPVTGRF